MSLTNFGLICVLDMLLEAGATECEWRGRLVTFRFAHFRFALTYHLNLCSGACPTQRIRNGLSTQSYTKSDNDNNNSNDDSYNKNK